MEKDKGFWVLMIGLAVVIMIFIFSSKVLQHTQKIHNEIERNSRVLDTIKHKQKMN